MIIIFGYLLRPKRDEKSSSKSYSLPAPSEKRQLTEVELEEAIKGNPFTRPLPGREILN